jgi:single-strand DNA-binding protein
VDRHQPQMNVNRVVITGNLAADPEVRQLRTGNSLCRLRIACSTRRRQPDGSWGEKSNYFDVVVWGAQGEATERFLSKGSAVAVDGRLEWREWTAESGEKRQAVEIVAENLEFLDRSARQTQLPSDEPAAADIADDDIPF